MAAVGKDGERWREHGGGLTPTLDANVDSGDFHRVKRRLVLLAVIAAGLHWSLLVG